MGMFTTVIHDGKHVHFKTGFDDGEMYNVGDKIPWEPDPYWPGSHIDGVHDGYIAGYDSGRAGADVWVIVKYCVIVAVEPFLTYEDDRQRLAAKYGITKPSHKLWTKEQWKAKHRREAQAKAEYEAWVAVHGDNPAGYYMHCKLRERSFISQILPAMKVKNGKAKHRRRRRRH